MSFLARIAQNKIQAIQNVEPALIKLTVLQIHALLFRALKSAPLMMTVLLGVTTHKQETVKMIKTTLVILASAVLQ